MTATQILNGLHGRDIVITLNGDRLKVDAPTGVLTDEDRQAVRDHKAELLALLGQADENIEIHDSALFDVVVEVGFYDGRRTRIPQQSTPAGWAAPF
jgi:hypothetical protein